MTRDRTIHFFFAGGAWVVGGALLGASLACVPDPSAADGSSGLIPVVIGDGGFEPEPEPDPPPPPPEECDVACCAPLPSGTIVACLELANPERWCELVYATPGAPDYTLVAACGACDASYYAAPMGAPCLVDPCLGAPALLETACVPFCGASVARAGTCVDGDVVCESGAYPIDRATCPDATCWNPITVEGPGVACDPGGSGAWTCVAPGASSCDPGVLQCATCDGPWHDDAGVTDAGAVAVAPGCGCRCDDGAVWCAPLGDDDGDGGVADGGGDAGASDGG